jgi:hypothetical protein
MQRTASRLAGIQPEGDTMTLIDRAKNILLTPKTEWPAIAVESATPQSLYLGYVLILAAIGPIAMALRGGIFGMGIGFAVVSYVVALAMTALLALIVDVLAPSFGGEKNFIRSLQLAAYSCTAAWVAGIFHLLPFVGGILSLLAAIYSIYTFYLGVPTMKKCPGDKAAVYTVVVMICGLVAGAVLSNVLFSLVVGGSMLRMMGPGML